MTTGTSGEAPGQVISEGSHTLAKLRRWLLLLVLAVVAYFLFINIVGRSVRRMFLPVDENQQDRAAAKQDAEMFGEVAGVSPSKFTEIRCFEDVSIDVSFHCRFRFADMKDVQRIIDLNDLRRRNKVPFLNQFGIFGTEYPDWYDLRSIPDDSPIYGSEQADSGRSMWLYIDVEEEIAYLETLN